MESYIEVTFIMDGLIIFTSHLLASYWCQRQILLKELSLLVIACVLTACLFWFPGAGLIQISMEGFALFWLFKNYLKAYFVSLGFRYLFFFTFYQLFQGSFHLGYWFVPIQNSTWILCSLLLICFNLMLLYSWGKRMQSNEFLYAVTLRCANLKIHCWATLDSGNNAEYNSIPIIFIDSKYFPEELKKIPYQAVSIKSINAISTLPCILCSIKIAGYKEQSVYVSIHDNLNPSCLLNRKLFIVR